MLKDAPSRHAGVEQYPRFEEMFQNVKTAPFKIENRKTKTSR